MMKRTSNTTSSNITQKPLPPINMDITFLKPLAIWYSMMNTTQVQDLPPRVSNALDSLYMVMKGRAMTDNTEPTIDDIEQEITNIFITIDNYGTDEEARVDIRKLISDQVAKARLDELKKVASHNNSEYTSDYIEDRIVTLNGVKNK